MSLSDFQKFLAIAETDTSLKAELKAIGEAFKDDSDDATISDAYDKFISLAASRDLKIVEDDFDEWQAQAQAQASEDKFKEMMTGEVELSDEEMESVAGGKKGGGGGGNNKTTLTVLATSGLFCW